MTGLPHVASQLQHAIVLLAAPHAVVLKGMNRPAIAAEQLLGGNLAAGVFAPGNKWMIEDDQRVGGAQNFKEIVQAILFGRRLQIGVSLFNAGGGQSGYADVEEVIVEVDGDLFAERIAMRFFRMKAHEFDAAADFVVVGDSQMDAMKAKLGGAGRFGSKDILDRERRAIKDVGIIQIGDRCETKCRLKNAPQRAHEAELDHFVEKSHVLNGVLRVIVQGDSEGELLRRLRAGAVGVVLDDPAIRYRHGPVFPALQDHYSSLFL